MRLQGCMVIFEPSQANASSCTKQLLARLAELLLQHTDGNAAAAVAVLIACSLSLGSNRSIGGVSSRG
jgi:hypothetical protein